MIAQRQLPIPVLVKHRFQCLRLVSNLNHLILPVSCFPLTPHLLLLLNQLHKPFAFLTYPLLSSGIISVPKHFYVMGT